MKLVRMTKDGILSIAGMLIEDPAVTSPRVDSEGNLYTHELIEDPGAAAVEWGLLYIRCRAFWEGGLWEPYPKRIYTYTQGKFMQMDQNLQYTVKSIGGTMGTVYAIVDDMQMLYLVSANQNWMMRIQKDGFIIVSTIPAERCNAKDAVLYNDRIVCLSEYGNIVAYTMTGQRVYYGPTIFSGIPLRIYVYNDKFYVVTTITETSIRVYELNTSYQITRQKTISITGCMNASDSILVDGALYIVTYKSGFGYKNKLFKMDLNSFAVTSVELSGSFFSVSLANFNGDIYVGGMLLSGDPPRFRTDLAVYTPDLFFRYFTFPYTLFDHNPIRMCATDSFIFIYSIYTGSPSHAYITKYDGKSAWNRIYLPAEYGVSTPFFRYM